MIYNRIGKGTPNLNMNGRQRTTGRCTRGIDQKTRWSLGHPFEWDCMSECEETDELVLCCCSGHSFNKRSAGGRSGTEKPSKNALRKFLIPGEQSDVLCNMKIFLAIPYPNKFPFQTLYQQTAYLKFENSCHAIRGKISLLFWAQQEHWFGLTLS